MQTNWNLLRLEYIEVSIDTTANSISGEAKLQNRAIFALDVVPDGDSWDAAHITFQVSPTTVDSDFMDLYYEIYDSDNGLAESEYKIVSPGAHRHYALVDPNVFAGAPYVRLRSGVSGTVVQQTDARTVRLWLRSLA